VSHDEARIRTLLALYRESHYDVVLPGGDVATMRIGERVPDDIADWIGAGEVAHYVTSCNPRSVSLTSAENETRLDRLRAELDARAVAYLEGAGHIPGESWREACVLVRGLGDDEVATIVKRYEQNSIVVVGAAGIATLRVYRDDWRAGAGDVADVEWR
jgi:hypothetical protein